VVGGVQDGNENGIAQGFQARIDRFNKAGGIDGRQIKLTTVFNDGSSLSTNLQDVQTLVLKDHVFAVTPYSSQAFNPASAVLIQQQNLPYIGFADTPAACQGAQSFPIDGCLASANYTNTYGWTEIGQAVGKPVNQLKVALIGIDNQGGTAGTEALTLGAKSAGAQVVYSKSPIPTGGTTDYTPYVQGIMASNPAVVYLVLDFNTAAAMTGALRQAGYQGAIVNPTAYVPGLLSSQKALAAALQGSFVTALFPPAEGNSAVVQQMQADLKASGQPTALTFGVQIGWFSADEFIAELQAVAKAGLPLTPANFVKTIGAGFTYTTTGSGGISGLTFPKMQLQPLSCTSLLRVKTGIYSVAAPYNCDESAIAKVS
jgi:ABC-type branched-subunit amino acid transport system substrate-binding protein